MTDERLKRFLLRAASAAAAITLLYAALRYLLGWLLPFIIALAAAAAIEPAVRFLQRKLRLKRSFASLVLTLFLLFLLGGLLSLLGTTLTGEAYALLSRAPALLAAVPDALGRLVLRLQTYCTSCPPWLRTRVDAALARALTEVDDLLGTLASRLPALLAAAAAALPRYFLAIVTSVLAIYFTSSSLPDLCGFLRRHFSVKTRLFLARFRFGVSASFARWLRAELTLCLLTFTLLLTGLTFLRQPYALLLAFLITLVDALPVFGTGTVLIPWAIIEAILQNIPKSIALGLLYLASFTLRSMLEPRLLGAQAGLPPILSLLAMYLGFCSMGVTGMIFFPFLLLLGAQLVQNGEHDR